MIPINIPIEKVAELFLKFVGDSCPCNYNDLDEKIPDENCNMECLADEHYLGCWIRYIQKEVTKN